MTGGIPRLMNLVCERALVGTFSKQQLVVDAEIVKQSAQESLPSDFVAVLTAPTVNRIARRSYQLVEIALMHLINKT